jgi:hypothetical protein
MRKIGAYVLIVLGVMLIALAPIMRVYALPRVLKAPLDTYATSKSLGNGTYFSLKELKVVSDRPLENVSTAKGDVEAGSETTAVYDYFSTTKDLSPEGGVIDAGTTRYAFDRVTGETVDCCGLTPGVEGITLKFPFYVKKTSYPFWDGTLGAAPPAQFSEEGTLEGLKVYIFKQHIEPTIVENTVIGGALAGLPPGESTVAFISYTADTTLWVEPFTGAILKGAQHAVRTMQNGGEALFTVSDTTLVNTPESVKATADEIKSKIFQLNMVRYYIPFIGPIIGVILLALGMVLLFRTPKSQAEQAGLVAAAPQAG